MSHSVFESQDGKFLILTSQPKTDGTESRVFARNRHGYVRRFNSRQLAEEAAKKLATANRSILTTEDRKE